MTTTQLQGRELEAQRQNSIMEELNVCGEAADELRRARALHAPMASAHEGYAVLLEEVEEFWEEVKKKQSLRDPAKMRAELIQIAAMALRCVIDCGPNFKK